MKLLIILSVIACSHAAKLDRTYLPPASAASAGGSSDSLRTPVSPSGASGKFGSSGPTGSFAPAGSSGSFAPAGSSGSFAPAGSSGSFAPVGSSGSFAPAGSSGSFAPAGSSGSFAPVGSSGSFAPSGFPGSYTPSGPSGSYAPSGPSGSQSSLPNNGAFGRTPGALNQPSAQASQYGQPTGASFDTGFPQPAQNFGNQAQNFGNQAQNYQRNQPERAQASADRNAEILRFDNQNDGETFSYNFETSNGIAAEESGVATNGVQAQGAYSYSDDNGQVFRVAYTADENGYQPQGEHLPTPHPIPEEILKSIEQNARAAAAGTQEGAYNPEEDNSPSSQAFNYNAPISYNQGPTGQSSAFNQGSTSSSGAFNQAQGKAPNQNYGAPNAASPSRIQGPQGPSQQYGAPTASFPSQSQGQFGSSGPLSRPQGFPSAQQYNAPNAGAPSKLQGTSQQYGAPNASPSRPNTFQGPSQQYIAPSAGSAIGQSSFNQPQSQTLSAVYGSPSNGAVRPNSFNENQGANGIASSASRPSGLTPAQAISNQYQTRPNQYSRPQGPTSSGQAQDESGYQYNKPQGSISPANRPSGQAQYRPQIGATQGSQGGFSKSNGIKPSESFRPASQSNQNYEAAVGPNAVGPKGSFGSTSQTSFGSPARPNAQTFGQPQGQSFNQGFSRPGQSQMSESGYQYNQPQGSQNFGSQGPQTGFKAAPGQAQTFGAPRQPPSFTEEEGYKY